MEGLSVATNSSEQTVKTQIRLLLKKWSGRDLHCLIFHFRHLNALLHANFSAAELVFDVQMLLSFYGIHKSSKNFSHRKHLFRAT